MIGEKMSDKQDEELIKTNFRIPKSMRIKIKVLAATNDMKIEEMSQLLLKLGIEEFEKQKNTE